MTFTLTWIPHPQVIADDFAEFSEKIKDYREPFERSVNQVVSPSIQQNFASGGRPAWAPLAGYTVEKKGHGQPLVDSGALQGAAGSVNSWSIGSDQAELSNVPEYGRFQNRGFYNVLFNTNVVARQWAAFQDQDIDGIAITFMEWIEQQYSESS